MTAPASSTFAAADLTSLTRLKTENRTDPKSALRQAAQQFESIMLNQMLKSMRETASGDGLFDSSEGRAFQGMLDQQWSSQIAQSRGMGIADMIVRQLGRNLPGGSTAETPVTPTDAPRHLTPPALRASAARQDLPQPAADIAVASRSAPAAGGPAQQQRQSFVQSIWPFAQRVAQQLGVAPQLVVAHAALETGWGRSSPATGGQSSFNLFGIKAGGRWQGAVAPAQTTEYSNGVAQRRTEPFRAYASMEQAFEDYARLLSGTRYAAVRNTGNDTAAFARGLQSAGYATDPNYARKLQQVASQLQSML